MNPRLGGNAGASAGRLASLALALCLAAPYGAVAGAATAKPSATPKSGATQPPPASPPVKPTAPPAPSPSGAAVLAPPVLEQARQFNAALLELARAEARLDDQILQLEDATGEVELPPAVIAEQATILRCLNELLRLAPNLSLPVEQRQLLLDYLALRRDSAELMLKHLRTVLRFEIDPAIDELDEQLQKLGIDIGALLGGGTGGEIEDPGGGTLEDGELLPELPIE